MELIYFLRPLEKKQQRWQSEIKNENSRKRPGVGRGRRNNHDKCISFHFFGSFLFAGVDAALSIHSLPSTALMTFAHKYRLLLLLASPFILSWPMNR
jgi:hypothetical protein